MEEEQPNLSCESTKIDVPEPEICLPVFPVPWTGVTMKRGGRTFQVTGGRDPVTGQGIYLHVELVKEGK
jgi:hypothetical protein